MSLSQALNHFTSALRQTLEENINNGSLSEGQTLSQFPDPIFGASIEAIGENSSFTLTLTMSAKICQILADRFIEIHLVDSDGFLPDLDTADVIGELLNMACGIFVASMQDQGHVLSIGLPTFLDGDFFGPVPSKIEGKTVCVDVGPLSLFVFTRENSQVLAS